MQTIKVDYAGYKFLELENRKVSSCPCDLMKLSLF
jgi:hypothetical protein